MLDLTHTIIALDADRTITRTDRSISLATKAAIAAVFQAGGQVCLCTGRTYAAVWPELWALFPPETLHVVAGGGLIANSSGQVKFAAYVDGQVLADLIQLAEAQHCLWSFSLGKTLFAADQLRQKLSQNSFFAHVTFANLSQIPTELSQLDVPMVYLGQPTLAINEFLQTHSEILGFDIMTDYQGNSYYDIRAKGVTKASGLKQLASLVGVDLANFIAVGDESIDLSMLQVVGWGVAMGNAIPELKKVAKQVIGHTDEDGLAKFLMGLVALTQKTG